MLHRIEELSQKGVCYMTREEIIQISNGYINGEDRNKLKEFFSDMNNVRTNRRTIVFSTPSETGTSFFRILEPLLSIYRATDDFNLVYTEKITPFMIEVADLIVMHRAGNDHDQIHTLMKYLPRDKVPPVIVHNVDDNEFNLPPSHPMKDMWIAMGKDKMAIRSISESDHVETTTRKLASTFRGYNNRVHVRRNRFNWNLPQWNLDDSKKKELFGDKLVLGWCGLTSHFNDLIKMKPILKRIQEKYPNVHILLAGMAISDKKYEVKRDPNTGHKYVEETEIENKEETYRARVAQLYSDLDQERLTLEDAVGLEEYGKFYSWMDIGISYIEHNGFNACKCLVSGSLVATDKGIQKIESIPAQGCATDGGDNIVANINYKDEKCVKIITENGYEIEGTVSHRIKDSKDKWMNFDSLQIGDIVKISPFNIKQTEYKKMTFPMLINKYENVNIEDGIELDESIFEERSMPTIQLTEKWAELFGMFLGDGHFRNGGNFSIALNKRDQDVIDYLAELLRSIGLKAKDVEETRSDCRYVNYNSKSLARIMLKYDFLKVVDGVRATQKNFSVPDIILQSPKSVISAFLRGLFEADGTVNTLGTSITFSTKSYSLGKTVQYLLLGFGIKSKLAKRIVNGADYYEVRMHKKSSFIFRNEIGFISKYKSNRLKKNSGKKLSNNHDDWTWEEKVVGKEYTENDVYDIEVSDTHTYNSNGFISHNSEIKNCEYAVYGSIPVYSNFGGYYDFHEIMKEQNTLDGLENSEEYYNKMAVNSEREQEWFDKLCYWIDMYINEHDQYNAVADRVKSFVKHYYSIDEHIHEQISFYSKLIEDNLERSHERVTRHYQKYAEMEID